MWRFMRSNFTAGLVSGVMFTLLLMFLLDRFYGDFSPVRYHGDPILLSSPVSKATFSKRSSNNTDDVKIEHPVVKNKIIGIPGLLNQETQNKQEDNFTLADNLARKVRILCWIMTSPTNLESKAIHVYKTWAYKCNKIVFVSSEVNEKFPAPVIKVDVEEGRNHLTAKTMHAFKHMYDNHFDEADWFMKADDDTFAIMENLRYFLSDKNPSDPVYYGHHFNVIVKPQGYYSGGGGYVLSREALARYATRGFHQPKICTEDGGAEDVQFGKCMQNLGVKTAESYDERGASRFHALAPWAFIKQQFPKWYLQYDSHGALHGIDAMSDYPITFHYVKPKEMYTLSYFTYHLKVYGVNGQNVVRLHPYYGLSDT